MGNQPASSWSTGGAASQITIEPTCRLFPPLIPVLPVVVPTCSATLVPFRWDQQRITDSLCHVSAGAETAQGRCKGRRQKSAQPMCQGELLEEERVSALKVGARELAASGGQAIPLEGHQAAPVTPQTHVSAQQEQTQQTDNRSLHRHKAERILLWRIDASMRMLRLLAVHAADEHEV
jgi:hypothetical protein